MSEFLQIIEQERDRAEALLIGLRHAYKYELARKERRTLRNAINNCKFRVDYADGSYWVCENPYIRQYDSDYKYELGNIGIKFRDGDYRSVDSDYELTVYARLVGRFNKNGKKMMKENIEIAYFSPEMINKFKPM